LAPGSQVVPQYLETAGVLEPLRKLGFHVVGFGCATCIGNSGPLYESISKAIKEGNLIATAVLSGNRNFEDRIHQEVRANYLASPPMVVAYALAGSFRIDIVNESLGNDADGQSLPKFASLHFSKVSAQRPKLSDRSPMHVTWSWSVIQLLPTIFHLPEQFTRIALPVATCRVWVYRQEIFQ
jgi:aconitase A